MAAVGATALGTELVRALAVAHVNCTIRTRSSGPLRHCLHVSKVSHTTTAVSKRAYSEKEKTRRGSYVSASVMAGRARLGPESQREEGEEGCGELHGDVCGGKNNSNPVG